MSLNELPKFEFGGESALQNAAESVKFVLESTNLIGSFKFDWVDSKSLTQNFFLQRSWQRIWLFVLQARHISNTNSMSWDLTHLLVGWLCYFSFWSRKRINPFEPDYHRIRLPLRYVHLLVCHELSDSIPIGHWFTSSYLHRHVLCEHCLCVCAKFCRSCNDSRCGLPNLFHKDQTSSTWFHMHSTHLLVHTCFREKRWTRLYFWEHFVYVSRPNSKNASLPLHLPWLEIFFCFDIRSCQIQPQTLKTQRVRRRIPYTSIIDGLEILYFERDFEGSLRPNNIFLEWLALSL